MEDNIIKSSYDKGYVSKKIDEKKETDKPARKTTKKTTASAKKETPAPKATVKKEEPKKEVVPSEVAVYSEGKLSHPALGRLVKGYNIVSSENAKEWMNVSNKVRMATPEEVAIAYGA